jgi:HEAT repeat protein
MSVESYLSELMDPAHEVTAAGLTQLSGLVDDEERAFQERWGELPTARRHEIMGKLLELADDNVELDFGGVFSHALSDEEGSVRERALSGLWESDDRRLIPLMVERLEHDMEDQVRAAAALGLGHFAALAEAGKLVERDKERVFQALMRSLEDEDEPIAVRRRALESVASFRDPDLREWIRWGYGHVDPFLRQSALFAMGRSCEAEWLPYVYREMTSGDPAMRFEAANAARETGKPEAVPHLAEMVEDTDVEVAYAALRAIGGIGGAKARKFLRDFIASAEDEGSREAAEEALQILEVEYGDFSMLKAERGGVEMGSIGRSEPGLDEPDPDEIDLDEIDEIDDEE